MSTNNLEELLTRRVQTILPSKAGLAKLLSTRKIKLYQGFDPSSPNLHLGHLVGLLQLKAFQDLGHEVIFLIGDFTGMIGDPTDKTAARTKLTREQVLANARTYKAQASKILRFDGENPATIQFNSTWLDKLNLADLIELTSAFTVQQLLERDMFQARLSENKPIYAHEFLYPVMVTYDALAMKVDLEIGGNDQLFNMTVGRNLLKDKLGIDKYALTLKLLTDAQGKKIGKTTGNAINLFGDPQDLYGAIMSQPDSILDQGFELITSLPLAEINQLKQTVTTQPMLVKKRLAFEVVSLCHSHSIANTAKANFENLFQNQKNTVADIPQLHLNLTHKTPLLDILKQLPLTLSNAQLKRVVVEGGVEVDNQKYTDPQALIQPEKGSILKFGKHHFFKLY